MKQAAVTGDSEGRQSHARNGGGPKLLSVRPDKPETIPGTKHKVGLVMAFSDARGERAILSINDDREHRLIVSQGETVERRIGRTNYSITCTELNSCKNLGETEYLRNALVVVGFQKIY